MRRLSFVLMSLLATCACSAPENQSALKHDVERPINEVSPFQWLDSTRGEFITQSLGDAVFGISPEHVLPEDHAATALAQSWIDRFDQRLRARFPKELRVVPRPKAIVILSKDINAFVSPMDECLKMPVRMAKAESTGDAPDQDDDPSSFEWEASAFILMRATQEIMTDSMGMGCISVERSTEEKQALLDWALEAYPGCRAQVAEEEVVLSGCADYVVGGTGVTGASELRVTRTSPYVTFLSSLMSTTTEEEFASVVAHELGHYYMSHITSPRGTYGFNYFIQERNHTHKPQPDPEANALGEAVRQILENELMELNEMEGQEFHSEIFIAMKYFTWRLIGAQCGWGSGECSGTCKAFDEVAQEDFGFFPWEPLDLERVPQVMRFEKELRACAAEIRIEKESAAGIGMQEGPTHAISWDDLSTAFSTVSRDHAEMVSGLASDEPITLLAALERLNAEVVSFRKKLEDKRHDIYFEAAEKRLGWYTVEQEADDLSAEWMTLLGLDPRHAVDLELKFIKVFAGTYPMAPTALGEEECRALYESGWTTGKGQPVFVGPSDFRDEHHSGCFRAFNISREIEAHGFDHRRHKPAARDPKRWERLARELEKLTEEAFRDPFETDQPSRRRRPGTCTLFDRR